MNKIYEAIRRLPDEPKHKVVWVTYNEDMKVCASTLIKLLKGEHYLDHCLVVSREKFNIDDGDDDDVIYYSPDLYDHIGNGAN